MADILVRRKWSAREVKRAEVAAGEYRHGRYTSGCAHVDDLIATGGALILCDLHRRKIDFRRARYRAHPAPELKRAFANCDWCRGPGTHWLYIPEAQAAEEMKKVARWRAAIEYGKIVTG